VLKRIITIMMLAGLAFAGSATPALAHDTLMDSFPGNGATLDVGPKQVQLQFDEPVQAGPGLNTVAVIGPRQDHWESCGVTVDSTTVSVPVRPLGPPGDYTIGWRVLSSDGHPVSGQLKFTLTKPGNGTPTPADELASCGGVAQTSGPAPAGDGGIPAAVWIVGAAVLLGLGVMLSFRMGRREEQDQG
jgi:copper resistance protein C